MKKSDARWTTTKVILSWLLYTIAKMILFPNHHATRLLEILNVVPPTQQSIEKKTWHKILSELQSMLIAIPICAGLFLVLQKAFHHEENNPTQL